MLRYCWNTPTVDVKPVSVATIFWGATGRSLGPKVTRWMVEKWAMSLKFSATRLADASQRTGPIWKVWVSGRP